MYQWVMIYSHVQSIAKGQTYKFGRNMNFLEAKVSYLYVAIWSRRIVGAP